MKNTFILDIVANYNDKKIQLIIERKSKEFAIKELYALHGKQRLAYSGEILYLVNPPSSTIVKYAIELDEKSDKSQIAPHDIQWSFDGVKQYHTTVTTKTNRNLKKNDNIITTAVSAGYPVSFEKSVDVKRVNGYNKKVDVVSPAVEK